MKMKYDSKTDSIFIELAKGTYQNTRKISDSILIDEDNKGKILGIEILDATRNIEEFNPKDIKLMVQPT